MASSTSASPARVKAFCIADTSTPVLVVSLTTHGPLGIIRSLGRLGVPVYALHLRDCQPAQYSRYLRRVWRWDFPYSSEGAMETLAEIGHEIGPAAILLPTSDETSVFVAENQATLRQWFQFPKQPSTLARTLSDKRQMYYLVKKHGLPTPETVFPQSRDEVLRFAADTHFPLVLKAIDGPRAARRTGQTMVIVHDIGELLKYYDKLEDPGETNFMLQEYIPGGDDTIWMFNGYFNEDSTCLYGATGKKVRQHPVGHGQTSLGICLQQDAVEQTTRSLMKALGYRGIVDIGYRWDARDGQHKVLDINPRIGCTFRLFTAEDGLDVARALYLDLTGQAVPTSKVREGRKWMVELQDFKSCLEYHRQGQLTLGEWLRSFRGVEEIAFFALDDPRPFRQMLSNPIFRRVKKLLPTKSRLRKFAPGFEKVG